MSGLFGGGGGGSSSSQTTNQTDNRRTIGSGGISAENSTVQVLDGGAISKAFDFGNKALDFGNANVKQAAETVSKALTFSAQSQQQVLDSLQSSTALVATAYNDAKGRGAMTDYILIGAVAMAGLVAIAALRK